MASLQMPKVISAAQQFIPPMLVASVAHAAFRRSVGVSAGNPTVRTRTLPTLRTIFL